jgi:ABC-type nitrate/sulfonate/bicarbonate transport system permease component
MAAIALLLLSLEFGLGVLNLVFVIVHWVLWAVGLNTHSGCLSVSETPRMAGQTFGLRGLRCVTKILVPAAFPSVLSGHKIDSAFAWRTLIAAELVFRVSSQGNLGWFIFENSNLVDTCDLPTSMAITSRPCTFLRAVAQPARCAACRLAAQLFRSRHAANTGATGTSRSP